MMIYFLFHYTLLTDLLGVVKYFQSPGFRNSKVNRYMGYTTDIVECSILGLDILYIIVETLYQISIKCSVDF